MSNKPTYNQLDCDYVEDCTRILGTPYFVENRPLWVDYDEDGKRIYTPSRVKKIVFSAHRYNLQEALPTQTIRSFNPLLAIEEILWIYAMRSNKVNDLKSKIWNAWAGEDGTIGHAYGWIINRKYEFKKGEAPCSIIDHIIDTLRTNPFDRRMVIDMMQYDEISKMNLVPCAYNFTLSVEYNEKHEKVLTGILKQRSQDVLTAYGWNSFQYAVLTLLLAEVSGLKASRFIHERDDIHIYDRHIDIVKQTLDATQYEPLHYVFVDKPTDGSQYELPTLEILRHKELSEFTIKDFQVFNFKCGPTIRFPVAI